MTTRTRLAGLLTLALLAPAFARQQQQQPPAPPEEDDEVVRVTTNLVQVDAVVTDKDGRQVTDLRAEDFEVLEDDRPQQITNFSYISVGAPALASAPTVASAPRANVASAPPVAPLRASQVRRTIALVVDDLGIAFDNMRQVQVALRKFVDEQVRPGDLVAVIRTGGDVGALQQFTSDRRQLHAAIERVRWNRCSRRGLSSNPVVRQDRTRQQFDPRALGQPIVTLGDELNTCSQTALDDTLNALGFVLQGMKELPGRKSLVVLSDSLPLSIGSNDPCQTVEAGAALEGTFASVGDTDDRRGPSGGQSNPGRRVGNLGPFQRLVEHATRASVVIYGVDTRGLQSLATGAQDDVGGLGVDHTSAINAARTCDERIGRTGPAMLAEQTGGFLIRNTNDIGGGLARVAEDQRGYYLIGYRPRGETFDRRFHRIVLRLKARPDLTVRARKGFYGVYERERAPAPRTEEDRLRLALMSPFAGGDLDVRLTALPGVLARADRGLRALLHIDPRGLTFTEESGGWHSATVEVSDVLFGDNGQIVDRHSRSHTVRVRGEVLKAAQQRGVDFVYDLPVKRPGAYRLRFAVRDKASARLGSAGQYVEVPDLGKNELALSGIAVVGVGLGGDAATRANAAREALTSPAPAEPVPPGTAAGNALASQSVRRFPPLSGIDFACYVFNARADRQTRRRQLTYRASIFRDGEELFAGEDKPLDAAAADDPKRLVAAGHFQLGRNFPAGDYILQVVVTDHLAPAGRRTAAQWIDFEITKP